MTNRREEIRVESTPASGWAYRYRRKYGYTFYGMITFIGIITLFFNVFIGIGIIGIGSYLLKKHYDYHKNIQDN